VQKEFLYVGDVRVGVASRYFHADTQTLHREIRFL